MFDRLSLVLAGLVLLSPVAAPAAGNVLVLDDVAKVDLMPGWRTDDGTHMAALRIRLAPGWKTYWRAPGEGGIPPSFTWAGSENLHAVAFHWPVPEVFAINGLRSIGYHDQLILPIELTPKAAGDRIELRTSIEFGVCEEICLPMQVDLSAALDASGAEDGLIRASLDNQPVSAAGLGFAATCSVDPIDDGLRLTARIEMPDLGSETAVVELPDRSIWVSSALTERSGGVMSATADLVPANAAPFMLDRSSVRITVLGKGRAVQFDGCTAG